MLRVNVHQAKTHLSRLLEQVAAGEVVTICRNNVPIAELHALAPARTRPRKLGRHKDQVTIHPSFFDPLGDDELDAWEGRGA